MKPTDYNPSVPAGLPLETEILASDKNNGGMGQLAKWQARTVSDNDTFSPTENNTSDHRTEIGKSTEERVIDLTARSTVAQLKPSTSNSLFSPENLKKACPIEKREVGENAMLKCYSGKYYRLAKLSNDTPILFQWFVLDKNMYGENSIPISR